MILTNDAIKKALDRTDDPFLHSMFVLANLALAPDRGLTKEEQNTVYKVACVMLVIYKTQPDALLAALERTKKIADEFLAQKQKETDDGGN